MALNEIFFHTKGKAIADVSKLTCQNEVQRIMGMVNYVSKCIPNVVAHTTNLRSLLCKDAIWHWTDKELKYIKNTPNTAPVMQFYDLLKKSKTAAIKQFTIQADEETNWIVLNVAWPSYLIYKEGNIRKVVVICSYWNMLRVIFFVPSKNWVQVGFFKKHIHPFCHSPFTNQHKCQSYPAGCRFSYDLTDMNLWSPLAVCSQIIFGKSP